MKNEKSQTKSSEGIMSCSDFQFQLYLSFTLLSQPLSHYSYHYYSLSSRKLKLQDVEYGGLGLVIFVLDLELFKLLVKKTDRQIDE